MPLQAATTENNHSQNSYRTLNVRDALSYLEQVKVRFQDQNEVYNQFLDVMKLFKTQSIDTPGVIERVSTLFRGYPSLIQGFNTFLPPGFRIECSLVRQTPPNNQEADLVTFYTPGEITHKTSLFPRDRGPAIILTNHPIGSLPPGWIHVSTDSQSTSSKNSVRPESPSQRSNLQSSSTDQPTALSSPTEQIQPNLPASSKPSNSSNKPSKSSLDSSHNDAPNLAIKAITNQRTTSPLRQDQPRPRSQNSNLLTPAQAPSKNQGNHEPISKSTSRNRKTNACPTNPGSLSRGPSPSLDGFVPTPIVSTRGSTPSNEFPINSRPSHSVPTSQPPTSGQNYSIESNNSKLPIAPDLTKTDSSHKFSQHHSSQAHKPPAPPARSNSTLPLPPQSAAIQLQPAPNALLNNSKPVEFNYAINYVNKIKHRFIDQPEIYKTFLEILQTYQRDGMPIDSVYVKVTKLFSNAADLLDEFKQFLPDLNASTATGQVPKYMFPPPAKTSSASKAIPHTPSGSSTKPNHDQLTNPSHRVTSDALTQRQSQSSLQNNSSTDPLHDSSRHPHKKISPTRSQSHGKVSSIFACVASPDLPMVLDPQVLSSTSSHALDPQVVNHAHSCAKLPAPIGTPSTSLSNNGFITNDLPSHSKTSTSHAISSTLPDSFPLHQKRLLPSHANSILPDDKPSEPPRKKRAFGGPLKNSSQEVAGLTLTKDLNNLTADCDVAAFPTEGLTAKKARRSKSKNASTDSVNPTVPHEPAPHKIPTLPEQHRSSQLHSHKELESSPHKIIGSSDQYRPPSNTLPYQVIDGHSGHPKLQLVQDPHLGSSALTDYSIWQPMYIETHDAMGGRTLTNTKELMLFESIKKYLNDQELWLEFLRVLDLYNQSIIDFKTLVDRVSVFIGDDDELLEDFKGLVGYDVKNDGLVEGEVWEIKNRDIKERDKVDASTIQKEYGPSYKRLPRVEIDLACSGRDELCWSVLNDEYFGAAKFGTESGGPGHRKTNFEEVIAMTEGERAHFSYWLECISRTIGHFESLQAYLNKMEDQDKANFNLGDNLGGISPSIYHRTLRKVYEAKYQTSILPYLRDYPINTIPIVLHRLKELELSWKSAESQWNLIWREVERKNYYRAQDHQVVGFKSAEKSLLKGQNLLKEIQDLKNNNQETLIYTVSLNEEEDVNGEGNPKTLQNLSDESSPDGKLSITLENKIPEKIIRSPSPSRASHQIELGFQDMEAFFDVLRIVIMALDRSTLSNPERRRIDDSIRTFIPAIWNISSSELEKQIPIIYDDESSGGEHSEEGGGHANQSTQNGRGGQTPTMDQEHKQNLLDQRGIQTLTEGLLKIQQTTQQESSSEQRRSTRSHNLDTPMSSPSHSYQLTPAEYVSSNNHLAPTCAQHLHPAPKACSTFNNNNENELNQTSFTGLKKWTKIAIPADPPHHPGNSTDQKPQRPVDSKVAKWYNVFGTPTYYLLIRLLHTLYSRLLKLKTIGKKLSHEKRRWRRINPVAIELGLSHPIIGLDDHPYPSTQLYPYCLDQLSRYFDGEIDFNSFEESIRVAFPKHGYLLSTVDKLTNSILKQFAQIHQEPKNRELLNLLKRERNLNSNESIVQISYRNQAESIVRTVDGDREEMFIRAEWHPDRMSLSVQILNEDDPTFEMTDPVDRLNHYIDTFEFDIDSALVQHSKVRKPFLRANLALINHATDEDRDDEDDDDIDNNSKDETNQSLTNGTIKRGKKEENEDKIKHEMNSITTGDPPLLDQIPDDIVLKEQKMKNNAKPRRLIIVNQSNIQLSIDPKTHKLKFNNRYHNSMIRDQDQPRRKEPTDLLFVKNFNSSSPALNVTATVPNNQIDNNNCFKSTHMDSERVRKFESWLINWYQGTSD